MMRRQVVWLIVVGIAVRLGLAAMVGLGVDESYMVAVARRVSLSYFDHPPLAFWLAHGSAAVFGGESRVVVRLPFVLMFAGTTWLVYRLGAETFGEPTGWLAALFLNVSAVFSVSTASWVLPDGPLMLGLTASAYCLARVLFDPAEEEGHAWRWWLAAGAAAGVAALSKYQSSLFMASVLLFLVTRPAQRRWLRRPEPYAAVLVMLLMFSPVLVWNAAHGWVSIAFQLSRGASPAHITIGRRLGALAQNIVGQAAWILPWIWVPLIAALIGVLRRRPIDDRQWFFACLAVVPIAVFTVVSLGGQPGLPHWPASGYLFLFPLVGDAAIGLYHRPMPRGVYTYGPTAATDAQPGARYPMQRVALWTVGSVLAFCALLTVAASTMLTGWPERVAPSLFRHGDPTLEALDWSDLRPGLDSLGMLARPRTFVAGTSWVQSGKVAYALGPAVPVLCLSGDPRGFGYLYDERAFVGEDAVIVDRVPARHDATVMYGSYFDHLTTIGRISVRRWGRPAFDVAIYLGQGFRRPYPTGTPVSPARRAGHGAGLSPTIGTRGADSRADQRGR
jgi:4-amino-4-deoxy-L-arabinose transferase-like glycosyltransferase